MMAYVVIMVNRLHKSIIQQILRFRIPIFLGIVAISLFFAYMAKSVEFDSSIDIWFLDNDPNLIQYHEFLDRFNADEVIVMGVFTEDIFSAEAMASIDRITRAAEKVKNAHNVTSLTNIRVAQGDHDFVEIGPLLESLPKTAKDTEGIRTKTFSIPLLQDYVSDDSKATIILVELAREGNDFQGKVDITRALREISKKEEATLKVLLTGSPPLDESFYEYSQKDTKLFMPLSALLVMLVIFIVFRKPSAAIVPLVVIGLSDLWVFGLMGVLEYKINIMTSSVLGVVLAIGVADSIHLLTDYYQQLLKGFDKREAITISFTELITPCFFTTTTTMAGMLSLLISDLKPVREFGLLAASGVGFAFIISMTVIPIVMLWVRMPNKKFLKGFNSGLLQSFLNKVSMQGTRMARIVVLFSVLIFILSILGISKLNIGANVMNYFKKDDPIRLNSLAVENKISGTASVEYLIKAEEGGLKEPENLKRVDRSCAL